MGADNSPTIVHAHPSLTLATDSIAAKWNILGICHAEVVPECCYLNVAQGPALVDRATIDAEPCDRVVTIQEFADTIPKRMIALPEQLVQRLDVIVGQGALIDL